MALSPDEKWVLARTREPRLTLLPTRAGESRALESGGLTELSGASWFADSRRFAFAARASGGSMRVFFQYTDGGERSALTPDGMDVRFPLVSEAAHLIAASGPEGEVVTFPIQGGEPRPVAGTLDGDIPIQWSPDGRLLYVFRPFDLPVTVFAVDLAAGSRRLWRGIAIPDTAGVRDAATVAMTPDGKFIAHSFTRALSDLYLVEGLR
jgi:Tol biopolymer transport system component